MTAVSTTIFISFSFFYHIFLNGTIKTLLNDITHIQGYNGSPSGRIAKKIFFWIQVLGLKKGNRNGNLAIKNLAQKYKKKHWSWPFLYTHVNYNPKCFLFITFYRCFLVTGPMIAIIYNSHDSTRCIRAHFRNFKLDLSHCNSFSL